MSNGQTASSSYSLIARTCLVLVITSFLCGCEMPGIPGVTYPAKPPGPAMDLPVVKLETEAPIKVRRAVDLRPAVRTVELGRSVKGEPISMIVFGDDENPCAFIFGGIHGEEGTAATTAQKLVEYLRNHHDLYKHRCIAVLPRANPDGLDANRRFNERGVDLNRNFPSHNFKASRRHGRYPSSEPETKAIIKAMNLLKPARIISIHSCRRGRHGNNWDGPAKGIADAMAKHNRYRTFGTWHNPTPGSFGNWAGIDQKIPTVTLELPNDLSSARCWADNREAIFEFIRTLPVGR